MEEEEERETMEELSALPVESPRGSEMRDRRDERRGRGDEDSTSGPKVKTQILGSQKL